MIRSTTLLLVALVALAGAPLQAANAGPLVVKTSFAPSFIYFGDLVTARVDVLFNPGRIDAKSVALDPVFGIWEELKPAQTAAVDSPTIDRRTWSFTLACFTVPCLPKGTVAQLFQLPDLTISARSVDGSPVDLHVRWPRLSVTGRFLPPEIGDVRPTLRLQTDAPAASYRVGPTPLALAFDVVGGLFVAAALLLLVREIIVWRRASRDGVDHRPPLVQALALVREAQRRDVEDRRRAAGLLARTLENRQDLSGAASEVAWSATQPSPDELEDLARTVESDLELRS